MLLTLAFRHLFVRKLRSLFLLLGFALGAGRLFHLAVVPPIKVKDFTFTSLSDAV